MHTHVEYESDAAYIAKHVLGLIKEETNYAADGSLISKTSFQYDTNQLENAGSAVQHDNANFCSAMQKGRGLLSLEQSWTGGKTASLYTAYNTNGSVVMKREGRNYGSCLRDLEAALIVALKVICCLRENNSERHLHTHRAD
jgi:hypothetical protein